MSDISGRIERSSLGTPRARAARTSVSVERARVALQLGQSLHSSPKGAQEKNRPAGGGNRAQDA